MKDKKQHKKKNIFVRFLEWISKAQREAAQRGDLCGP